MVFSVDNSDGSLDGLFGMDLGSPKRNTAHSFNLNGGVFDANLNGGVFDATGLGGEELQFLADAITTTCSPMSVSDAYNLQYDSPSFSIGAVADSCSNTCSNTWQQQQQQQQQSWQQQSHTQHQHQPQYGYMQEVANIEDLNDMTLGLGLEDFVVGLELQALLEDTAVTSDHACTHAHDQHQSSNMLTMKTEPQHQHQHHQLYFPDLSLGLDHDGGLDMDVDVDSHIGDIHTGDSHTGDIHTDIRLGAAAMDTRGLPPPFSFSNDPSKVQSKNLTRSERLRGPKHHTADDMLHSMFSKDQLRLPQPEWKELLSSGAGVGLQADQLTRLKQLRRRSKCQMYSSSYREKKT